MPVAIFQAQPGSFCQMVIKEEGVNSLVPQEQGFVLPFVSSYEITEPGFLEWYVSYLYAELWSTREHGPVLIAPSLPEFTSDDFQPNSLRFPLTPRAFSLVEALRQGGDVQLMLHIQATMVGTAKVDQIPDPARRRTLLELGLDKEFFGPLRRSQNVALRITKADWEEKILPQWDPSSGIASPVFAPQQSMVGNSHLDVGALARTLHGASLDGDIEDIVRQFRAPITGL